HLISVGLHLLVCVLLDANLARARAPVVARYASLATFGMLGIHAEPVAVISFREDLLAAALGLAALYLATPRGAPRPPPAASIGAVLCMMAATGAKLSAAPLPVFAWLWWRWPRWRPAAPNGAAAWSCGLLALGVALGLGVRWHMAGQLMPYAADDPRLATVPASVLDQWATGLVISAKVLAQTVLPFDLRPEYTPAHHAFTSTPMRIATAGFITVVVASLLRRWRHPAGILSVMFLAWLVLWLPTSNVLPLPNPRADRYAYLPSVPICIALGALFERALSAHGRWRSMVMVTGAAFIVLHGSLGVAASRSYRSNANLWRVASERTPDSARAQAMHGILLLSRLDSRPAPDTDLLDAAETACQRALALDATDAHPHLCFARLRTAQKNWAEALTHLTRGVERAPVRQDSIEAARLELLPDVLAAEPPEQLRAVVLERSSALMRRYPYSPSIMEATGRVLHRLGLPYQAGMAYRAASHRRPERGVTIARRIALGIDLGDLEGVEALLEGRNMLRNQINETERTALLARFRLLSRLRQRTLVHSATPTAGPLLP
ncbi:MAG: hypothetical protein ACPHRO_00710, partial [Nannocystaceae bacterium]